MIQGGAEIYSDEFSMLQEFFWEDDTPSNLAIVHEPSTFITPEAYKFLIPRVFVFCEKWGSEVLGIDFLDVFFSLPLLDCDRIGVFESYSDIQKKLVWDFLIYGSSKFEFGSLKEDRQTAETIRKRLLD